MKNMNVKKMTSTAIFSFLLTLSSLSGAEAQQNHVPVGSRAEPIEETMLRAQKRAEIDATEEKSLEATNSPEQEESNMSTGWVYTSHPGAIHHAMNISFSGDSIELEDGSIWTVNLGDTYKIANWLPGDRFVITPNHSWFSNYQFQITNQETAVSVQANLSLGPVYNGVYTYWIVAIDDFKGLVYLNDGSVWVMSSSGTSLLSGWAINDTIIMGVNDGWFSSRNPNILINVNTIEYASAALAN